MSTDNHFNDDVGALATDTEHLSLHDDPDALVVENKGPEGPPADKSESAAMIRQAGWTKPVPYDYAAFGVRPVDGLTSVVDGEIDDSKAIGSRPEFVWAHGQERYEWDGAALDDDSNVGPPNQKLEEDLFRNEWHNMKGDLFANITKSEPTIVGPKNGQCPQPVNSFADMPLHWLIKDNLKISGWTNPTPVQAAVIPIAVGGFDIVAIAQTGTGKTAAFLLPIISKLIPKSHKLCAPRPGIKGCESIVVRAEPLVVIVVPTRELAMQCFDEARRWCYRTMLRPCVVYGGAPVVAQKQELQKGCDILIGTLGRINDILNHPDVLSLNRVKHFVIDEADELLNEDWETPLQRIVLGGDASRDDNVQYLMFSATFPRPLRKIAKHYLSEDDHVRVRIGRMNEVHNHEALTQRVIETERNQKDKWLYDELSRLSPCRTMVFVNSKNKVDILDDFLFNNGFPCTSLHAGRNQREREDAIRAFRQGVAPILICTAIAARGLDVKFVGCIINYDLPSTMHGGIEEYIHRIGRTARIGNKGTVISFYNDDNADIGPDLVKILIEAKQEFPSFLEQFNPEDGVKWEDNDDWETLSEPDAPMVIDDMNGDDDHGGFDGGSDAGAGGFTAADDNAISAPAFTAAEDSSAGFDAGASAQNGW